MDLRIVKTRAGIREAFLALRKDKPLKKIQVSEICRIALINKTTFYKHYQNVFDLSEELERQTIDDVMENFQGIDSLFTDPEYFFTSMVAAMEPYSESIPILFHGRMGILAELFEKQLKDHYLTDTSTVEDEIVISFLVGGATRVTTSPDYDYDIVVKTLVQSIKKMCG